MKNIFVGNLSFGATEDSIRSLFESHGMVDRVSVVTDRDTGQPRGFAFVEMTNDGEGQQAIDALNGRELNGRALTINEARPKEARGGNAYRSNGGGGQGQNRRWSTNSDPWGCIGTPTRSDSLRPSVCRCALRARAVHF